MSAADLTFDPVDENGSPRVFVGMHRPPFAEISTRAQCEHGCITSHYSTLYVEQCYAAGHFDRPLYRRDCGETCA